MSADDFQTKYASVMESMLKSAVAETTKLFETMVDELKAEISRMKKENEDLKARCSQFETAISQTSVYTRESDSSVSGRSDVSEKRDTAVQCDLVPLRTVLVEQCLPLGHSSLQDQNLHCDYGELHYALQEHDYGSHEEEDSQMAFILVKQEAVLKQEEVESTVVSRQSLRDKPGSPWASHCGNENEGPFINSVCSTRETPLSPRQEETQVAMELPFLVTCSALQGAQNQSSEPEESLVISLAAVKDDIEEENEVSQRKSEIVTKGKPVTSEHRHQSEVEPIETERPSVVPQQCQSESETSANGKNISLRETADVGSTHEQVPQPTPLNDEEAFDQSKNGAAEVAASSQPGVATRRRRGRPPKKAKHLPVKEKLQSQSSNIPAEQGMENSPSPAGRCSSENKELPESQELKVDQGGVEILTPSTKVSPTVERPGTRPAESPKVPSVQPDKCGTSVTLQDAMLLVEAMNQSAVGSANSSPQRTAEPPQNQCAHHVGASQPVDEAQVKPQAPQPVVETHTKDAQAQIPKQQHNVSLSNTSTSKMPPSNVGTQTNVQALKKQPMITAVTTNRRGKAVPHKIIIVPRSGSSFTPHKIAGLSTSELPTVMSTVFVAQNKSLLPSSTASLSSVPHKTIYVSPSKPVVSKSPTNPTDLQSRTLLQPKITTVISRPVSAVASRKCQSQTIVPPAQQELAKTAAPAMVSSSLLISSLQDWTAPVESETAFNEVAIISSQKSDNTSDNFKSPKQTASVCAKTNSSEEICSTLSTPVGPTSMSSVEPCTSKQNVSAVVKLSRLQIPLSTTESVLVSELSKNGSSEHQSTLKDGPTEEKPSVGKARQLSETLVVSTDNSPSFNETSLNTSQMLDEPNDIHGKASLSPENCTTLVSQYVQPTTPTRVSHPVTEKSAKAIQASDLEDFQILFDHQMEETESAAIIHLTTTKSKDTSDPHVQMTKTQFLAQLSVSPVDDTPKVSPDRSSEETSTSDKKRSQKNSLMAQLRSHIRTHFQAKRAESNPEPRAEMESLTGSSPKRPRLENDHPKDSNTTIEPVPLSPTNPGADEDVTSLIKTTNDSTPVSLKTSGLCKDAIKPKRIVCVSSTISSRRSQPTGESAPVNPRRSNLGREGVGSKNKKSPSVSPRRSSSTKENATPENIENSEVQPRRTSSTKGDASSKNAKSGGSPSSGTKATAVKPKRTTSSSDSATPTRTNSPSVSLRTSGLSATPKMSIGEPTYFCRRKCTLPKDDSSTKEIKKESSSFSPQPCSATADGYTSETVSTSVKVNKLSKDGNSPRRNSESTSVKKNILSQDASTVQKNLRAVNAKKLTQAAKAKTIAKMKSSSQSKLQKGAKGKQLAESSASSKALKKCTAVWTPPRLPANRIPLVGGKKTANSPVKKEIISPRSQGQPMVFPHSVSLHPIPVRAPPVVSPLQPLSVIGRRLLKNQCGECGRVLSSSAALESHVSLHTGRRPFSCTLCGKRFADSKGLKRHGRVHRNGRIHVCQQCGKGFVYRFGLTKHLQMVHSRIKPFVCQICNKGCFTKLDVEAHIRIHTGEKPFHCNLCEKKFARRVDLNVHLRWHNGEKRHWCPYCGKGFLDFNNMKRHKYIHTGEKPHACPHCPKHFTQSGHLKKHVKNVHKIQ